MQFNQEGASVSLSLSRAQGLCVASLYHVLQLHAAPLCIPLLAVSFTQFSALASSASSP